MNASNMRSHLLKLLLLIAVAVIFTACPGKNSDFSVESEAVKSQSVSSIPETTNKSSHCKSSEVHTLIRPAFPNKNQSETSHFTYSFRIKKATPANVPTIIYLPGGPGDPSIEREVKPWMDQFNYIFTDLRGSGCNEFSKKDLPDDAIQTQYAAADILAMIDYLKDSEKSGIHLGSYIICGASYGTVLATVVGSQIENSARPLPSGIVLEGTLGKHREFDSKFHISVVRDYWTEIRDSLPEDVKKEFLNNPSPFGLSVKDWDAFVAVGLSYGSKLVHFNSSTQTASWKSLIEVYLDGPPNQDRLDIIKNMRQAAENSLNATIQSGAYPNIACHELGLSRDEKPCKGIPVDRPYDSARYQLRTPLFYFQGEMDPNVLMEEARYHYDHQLHAPKTFVTFKRGGHTPLQVELESVTGPILEAIVQDHMKFEEYLNHLLGIGAPITITKSPAS